MLRVVRAVNRGAGQTGYVIFALTCAGQLPKLLELYGQEGLDSEVAYWNDTNSKPSGLCKKLRILNFVFSASMNL